MFPRQLPLRAYNDLHKLRNVPRIDAATNALRSTPAIAKVERPSASVRAFGKI